MARRMALIVAALILMQSAAAAQGMGMGMGMGMGRGRSTEPPDSTTVENAAVASSDSLAAAALAKVKAVFAEHCIGCHGDRRPLAGLRLSTDADLAALAQTTSSEIDTFMLVAPGHPEKSYLLLKIEGSKGIVGSRMPLGGRPLSKEEVGVVEEWIRSLAVADTTSQPPAGEAGGSSN
jgi:mono/diheme cytochrome c family protein